MPVTDGGGARPVDGLYAAVCAQEELEFELWLRQGWRRQDPDRRYHRQAQLDAARAGAPIDVLVSSLPAPHRPAASDMFDRVTVSPDGSMRFTGADFAAWERDNDL
ncbi:hypothetical protein [Mycobacterium sp.]|uniref:hypothetical protein n=1 Tax=Mycobacterium sp. TaxID=1785 RepID=UPI003D6BE8CE